MKVYSSVRAWAQATVLLAAAGFCSGGAHAEDICRPPSMSAPRRPVMQTSHKASPSVSQADYAGSGTSYIQQTQGEAEAAAEEPAEDPWEPATVDDEPFSINNWLAPKDSWAANNNIKFGGNFIQSYTFNFDSPNDKFNGPVTWTDRSNEYQLNQAYNWIEKSTSTEEKDWDIGGRADLLYGTNARFDTAGGLEDNINKGSGFYALAIPQFYGEIAYKSTKTKIGHYISPVGYNTVDSGANFFNTLPYTFQYGEPFTHTGTLTTWTVSDALSLGGGVTRGWDSFDRSNANTSPNLGYIGTANYKISDKTNVAYVNLWSNELNQGGTYSSRYAQTFVLYHNFNDSLSYIFQSDFGTQDNALANGRSAQWYGINQYLFYKTSDKVTWGGNFEWFRDDGGFRVGGFLPTNAPSPIRGLSPARSGFDGNFYQITVGPKWTPINNVMIRPNLRFDWSDTRNAAGLRPFDDGNKSHQTILGTDLVISY